MFESVSFIDYSLSRPKRRVEKKQGITLYPTTIPLTTFHYKIQIIVPISQLMKVAKMIMFSLLWRITHFLRCRSPKNIHWKMFWWGQGVKYFLDHFSWNLKKIQSICMTQSYEKAITSELAERFSDFDFISDSQTRFLFLQNIFRFFLENLRKIRRTTEIHSITIL